MSAPAEQLESDLDVKKPGKKKKRRGKPKSNRHFHE
jgi:hypothetical protein